MFLPLQRGRVEGVFQLGLYNDEKIFGGGDGLVQDDAGLLNGVGLIRDNFPDLADDQIFGDLVTGEGKDAGAGAEGSIAIQIGNDRGGRPIDVLTFITVLQLGGKSDIRLV